MANFNRLESYLFQVNLEIGLFYEVKVNVVYFRHYLGNGLFHQT